MKRHWIGACVVGMVLAVPGWAAEAPRLKVLFLGDNGHHRPAERFRQLEPVFLARGIDLVYTDQDAALNPRTLAPYDALLIYSNSSKISPDQERALLDFVSGGKGLAAIHCASFCYQNSPKYIELVGAQFQKHGTGIVRTELVARDHPILRGFRPFTSWDETYVHTKHNPQDRTILEERPEGASREPWTWVKPFGKGRVFYTAWGHDQRTWSEPGFQDLLARGVFWSAGREVPSTPARASAGDPVLQPARTDVAPFEYVPAKVPYYPPPGERGRGAEPMGRMQKPLSVEESMKHYRVPVGFELQLFADEAMLGGKPICMNWDERGRLWVAVSIDYPNELQPEGRGRDRILVLEDTDGDGRADKVTVFADKLSIPTSLIPVRGGVVVHQAPHTLFLQDTDGDGRADLRRVLFTGWGTRDTHAGPSNLHYGPDNWLHGIVGYSGFEGTIAGQKFNFKQGFYRFRPDGSQFEFLRSTSNNSWGLGISEEGLFFGSTANGVPSVHLNIPNRYFEKVRGWSASVLPSIADTYKFQAVTDKIRQVDWHGGFTAAAGHALYTARAYPPAFWNRVAFVTDPTGHLAATLKLIPDGADFRATYGWNLLASDDEWAAPVMAEVGPDGHVWVIDWYAFIVQHNPTPPGFTTGKGAAYETPLRDKIHGRIYRVVYRDAPPAPRMSLHNADAARLVAALQHDNMFWRKQAQRLLVERGQTDVVPDLLRLLADPAVDPVGLNVGAIHALWTLQGLNALGDPVVERGLHAALRHASPGVRLNAARLLPGRPGALDAIRSARLLGDADAKVRLHALLALADLPAEAAAGALLAEHAPALVASGERSLLEALTCAAAVHDRHFLAALARRAAPLPEAWATLLGRVGEHFARGAPEETAGELLARLAAAPDSLSLPVLAGMLRGWPAGHAPRLTEAQEKTLAEWITRMNPAGRGRLFALAARWGSDLFAKSSAELAASFLAQVRDEKLPVGERVIAAGQLIDFRRGDANASKQLLALITPQAAPELARGVLDAAARSETPGLVPQLLELFPNCTPAIRPAVLRILLARQDGITALLDAAQAGAFRLTDLALDQRQALTTHPSKTIAARARQLLAGGLPDPDREKIVQQWMPLTQKRGDAEAGKVVFKNQCAKCHVHSGEGTKIGPELTGMAVHPKSFLLAEILDPNRSLEGNYRQYSVLTKAGKSLSGLLASESQTAIELIDAEGQRQSLQRSEIAELEATNKSLMPEGFEKQIAETDFVNLLEFLTRRGKYLPVPIEKSATVVSDRGMFHAEESAGERMIFEDWSPRTFEKVPFVLVDPRDGRVRNMILLQSPNGAVTQAMPKSVTVPCNSAARAIHLLSGVSGWGHPGGREGSVSLIVRLHYAQGGTEDHKLANGVEFADYIRRVDVPGSKFAFSLKGKQLRYLAIQPRRPQETIREIEFLKGPDRTAPVIAAVTIELDGGE